MLKIENVSFSYGHQQILNNVNLEVMPGKIVGLIGENGAGKTTLMKIISGIYKAKTGKIFNKIERIGTLIECPAVYTNLSVQQNMEFFRELYGESKERMKHIMSVMEILDYQKKSASKLSLGMKQRLGVAIALLASTELVLLDEPTNGLDPSGIKDLLALIKKFAEINKTTFIISSHIFQNLETICEDFYIIRDNKLFDVYNMPGKYTHYLVYRKEKYEEILQLLEKHGILHKTVEDNIFIENKIDDQVLTNKLSKLQVEFQKRKLQEVYFE